MESMKENRKKGMEKNEEMSGDSVQQIDTEIR